MREWAPDLFVEESTVQFLGFTLQTRMAVVRLPNDELFVYSPVFLTPPVHRALDGLGKVAFVVSPNKIHNQTLSAYRAEFPEARHLAPPGLAERRKDLTFDGSLEDPPPDAWKGHLDFVLTRGNIFFSEALFFHEPSRTLLVGDLVENIGREALSMAGRAAFWPFGVRPRPMPSPEFRYYTLDVAAAEASLERARAWPVERIFLCHGGLVETRAQETFGAVCDELLTIARRRGRVSTWLQKRMAALN